MKVIPVIDILNGIAVHAVRGKRSEYQPLKSVLCTSTEPLVVASAFKALGFRELYIADLDAIMGGQPNFSILKRIVDVTGLNLMVDAGVADIKRAEKLLGCHVSKVVIGTETLPSFSFVKEAVESFGKERVVVSLDLKGEEVLSKFSFGKLGTPLEVLRKIHEVGVEQIIILDLARVGSDEGVNMPLMIEILKKRLAKVFVGGGVRDTADLVNLRAIGVFGALVATALHSGRITPVELKQTGLLF